MTHFYEPRLGHPFKHDPFNSIVGPRPIGWISSQSSDGILNLAPYSFSTRSITSHPSLDFLALAGKIHSITSKPPVSLFGTWSPSPKLKP